MTGVESWNSPEPRRGPVRLELADARRLLRRANRGLAGLARADERPTLTGLLWGHLGEGADRLPVAAESWPSYEHVNMQVALDAWLAAPDRSAQLVGVIGFQHRDFGLADLLAAPEPFGPRPGNVARVNLPAGPEGQVRPCVQCGVLLVTDGPRRTALLVRAADTSSGPPRTTVQIVSTDPAYAVQAAEELRALALTHNVFRRQVLSFGNEVFGHGETLLRFHRRSKLGADRLVLPAETLAAVRRQVVDVARHKRQQRTRGLTVSAPASCAPARWCA